MQSDVTADFIRRALDGADLNALRVALYQATRDAELVQMAVELRPARGGAFLIPALSEQDGEVVQRKALDFLLEPANRGPGSEIPTDAELRSMMEMLAGQPLEDREFSMGREELALEDFPRDVTWTDGVVPEAARRFHVVVVGAGVSGIAMAIKLSRLGIGFTVIERQDDLAGTWHRNTYPDVRVDTNAFIYQFKFEKRYPWKEHFPSQPEVKKYLRHIAHKYCVADRVRLGVEVTGATWDEADSTWRVSTRDREGNIEVLVANAVVSASGLFSTAKLPALDGIENFRGETVHTADWRHDLDYAGKRVGLIGNGSTGTQILPSLASRAAHVTAFQRTPSWIVEVPALRSLVSEHEKWLFSSMPYYWNWVGYVQFHGTSGVQRVQQIDNEWRARGGLINEKNDALRASLVEYVRSKVGHDPHLFDNSVPDYAPLARRLVIDNGWFDALNRDNVDLNVDGIECVVPEGIVTGAGETIPLDVIVFATGFEVSSYFYPVIYEGRGGVTFADLWQKDGARAYLGLTMPQFPNFYCLYGPNAVPRAGSFMQWVDVWTRYISQLLIAQIEGGYRSVECRQEIFDDYNSRMDGATSALLWEEQGQGGYFVNEQGRSGVQMPWLAHEYHAWVRSPNLTDYELK
jgi:4-hydroxyacetophenone monooxygenase